VLLGWTGSDYDKGRSGASEELLTQLARKLAKDGHNVTIYRNGVNGNFDGVNYLSFGDFKPYLPTDIFISFKNKNSLIESVNAKKKFHWSAEIEDLKPFKSLANNLITMSNFHFNSCGSVGQYIYNFVDFDEMDRYRINKVPNTALYSSSYDRGLEEILLNWPRFREALQLEKLTVIYGWKMINEICKVNPKLIPWRAKIQELLKQDGIEELGEVSKQKMIELYWQSQYWVHPVNNPQSELFCVNAVRAQYTGCLPVVRRIGALQETVNQFVDFDKVMGQRIGIDKLGDKWQEDNRLFSKQFSFDNVYKQWTDLLFS